MDRTVSPRPAVSYLYPPIEPFDRRMLDVGNGHHIYLEQSGNPLGQPILVVHGGPGGGTSPAMRRFFDPTAYRIVMFDQRGCGNSRPLGEVRDNTTQDLIADMETIRDLLGIRRWALFGGSWGATLSLAYAITHPERVTSMVLRGIFLGTKAELAWFYGGGAAHFFPEEWSSLTEALPEAERGNVIKAYHDRLFSGDLTQEMSFGRLWANWENHLAALRSEGHDAPLAYARIFARLEAHYFHNDCFLPEDDWIYRNRFAIADIPSTIVQGRYDMICPPSTAFRLAQGWSAAQLVMVPAAGHAMSEPAIAAELVRATNRLRDA